MSLDLEINGLVAWVLLSVPIALLFGVACHALRWRTSTSVVRSKIAIADTTDLVAIHDAPEVPDHSSVARNAAPYPGGDDDVVSKSGLVKFSGILDHELVVEAPGDAEARELGARITSLEAAGEQDGELGVLYLQLAEHKMRDGARREATELIRKCITLALNLGDVRVHGHARMALAAAAVDDGDLAGACEHWQLARELFSGAGSDTASHKIGAHMHRCGCPSDWVLTQF